MRKIFRARGAALRLDPLIKSEMGRVLDLAKRLARQNASGKVYRRRSGRLERSVFTRLERGTGQVSGILGSTAFYSAVLERTGRRSKIVRATRKRALRFRSAAGQVLFRPRALLKALRARPFLRPAAEDAVRKRRREAAAAAKKALRAGFRN